MTRIIALAAGATIALTGMSCRPVAGDIFPMSVGSIWNMDAVVTVGPAVASLDTTQAGTVVITAVAKARLTTGEEVVKFRDDVTIHGQTPDSTYAFTSYSYYREDSDWVLDYSALDDSTGDTVMVTTPSVGKTWHQGSASAEVIGQEDVTVPVRTYKNAWKVKVTESDGAMFYWYAAGVGMVRWCSESENQGVKSTSDLELTSVIIK